MRRLRLNATARRDLAAITRHLALSSGDPAHARDLANKLGEQCYKLSRLPGTLGRPRNELEPGMRSFPFRRYIIFFRYPDEDTMEVVNIVDARRDLTSFFNGDTGDTGL